LNIFVRHTDKIIPFPFNMDVVLLTYR